MASKRRATEERKEIMSLALAMAEAPDAETRRTLKDQINRKLSENRRRVKEIQKKQGGKGSDMSSPSSGSGDENVGDGDKTRDIRRDGLEPGECAPSPPPPPKPRQRPSRWSQPDDPSIGAASQPPPADQFTHAVDGRCSPDRRGWDRNHRGGGGFQQQLSGRSRWDSPPRAGRGRANGPDRRYNDRRGDDRITRDERDRNSSQNYGHSNNFDRHNIEKSPLRNNRDKPDHEFEQPRSRKIDSPQDRRKLNVQHHDKGRHQQRSDVASSSSGLSVSVSSTVAELSSRATQKQSGSTATGLSASSSWSSGDKHAIGDRGEELKRLQEQLELLKQKKAQQLQEQQKRGETEVKSTAEILADLKSSIKHLPTEGKKKKNQNDSPKTKKKDKKAKLKVGKKDGKAGKGKKKERKKKKRVKKHDDKSSDSEDDSDARNSPIESRRIIMHQATPSPERLPRKDGLSASKSASADSRRKSDESTQKRRETNAKDLTQTVSPVLNPIDCMLESLRHEHDKKVGAVTTPERILTGQGPQLMVTIQSRETSAEKGGFPSLEDFDIKRVGERIHGDLNRAKFLDVTRSRSKDRERSSRNRDLEKRPTSRETGDLRETGDRSQSRNRDNETKRIRSRERDSRASDKSAGTRKDGDARLRPSGSRGDVNDAERRRDDRRRQSRSRERFSRDEKRGNRGSRMEQKENRRPDRLRDDGDRRHGDGDRRACEDENYSSRDEKQVQRDLPLSSGLSDVSSLEDLDEVPGLERTPEKNDNDTVEQEIIRALDGYESNAVTPEVPMALGEEYVTLSEYQESQFDDDKYTETPIDEKPSPQLMHASEKLSAEEHDDVLAKEQQHHRSRWNSADEKKREFENGRKVAPTVIPHQVIPQQPKVTGSKIVRYDSPERPRTTSSETKAGTSSSDAAIVEKPATESETKIAVVAAEIRTTERTPKEARVTKEHNSDSRAVEKHHKKEDPPAIESLSDIGDWWKDEAERMKREAIALGKTIEAVNKLNTPGVQQTVMQLQSRFSEKRGEYDRLLERKGIVMNFCKEFLAIDDDGPQGDSERRIVVERARELDARLKELFSLNAIYGAKTPNRTRALTWVVSVVCIENVYQITNDKKPFKYKGHLQLPPHPSWWDGDLASIYREVMRVERDYEHALEQHERGALTVEQQAGLQELIDCCAVIQNEFFRLLGRKWLCRLFWSVFCRNENKLLRRPESKKKHKTVVFDDDKVRLLTAQCEKLDYALKQTSAATTDNGADAAECKVLNNPDTIFPILSAIHEETVSLLKSNPAAAAATPSPTEQLKPEQRSLTVEIYPRPEQQQHATGNSSRPPLYNSEEVSIAKSAADDLYSRREMPTAIAKSNRFSQFNTYIESLDVNDERFTEKLIQTMTDMASEWDSLSNEGAVPPIAVPQVFDVGQQLHSHTDRRRPAQEENHISQQQQRAGSTQAEKRSIGGVEDISSSDMSDDDNDGGGKRTGHDGEPRKKLRRRGPRTKRKRSRKKVDAAAAEVTTSTGDTAATGPTATTSDAQQQQPQQQQQQHQQQESVQQYEQKRDDEQEPQQYNDKDIADYLKEHFPRFASETSVVDDSFFTATAQPAAPSVSSSNSAAVAYPPPALRAQQRSPEPVSVASSTASSSSYYFTSESARSTNETQATLSGGVYTTDSHVQYQVSSADAFQSQQVPNYTPPPLSQPPQQSYPPPPITQQQPPVTNQGTYFPPPQQSYAPPPQQQQNQAPPPFHNPPFHPNVSAPYQHPPNSGAPPYQPPGPYPPHSEPPQYSHPNPGGPPFSGPPQYPPNPMPQYPPNSGGPQPFYNNPGPPMRPPMNPPNMPPYGMPDRQPPPGMPPPPPHYHGGPPGPPPMGCPPGPPMGGPPFHGGPPRDHFPPMPRPDMLYPPNQQGSNHPFPPFPPFPMNQGFRP